MEGVLSALSTAPIQLFIYFIVLSTIRKTLLIDPVPRADI
jgi:hypothetical protein